MKPKAPAFTWPAYEAALAQDPNFDPFTAFSFNQISTHERGHIAQQIIEARLSRAKPAQEQQQ